MRFIEVEGELTEAQLEAIAGGQINVKTSLEKEIISKQKREKFTATTTPEKLSQQKPFVQIEGELTEAQLQAIAAGGVTVN